MSDSEPTDGRGARLTQTPTRDALAEGRRLAERADGAEISLRVTGGVGVALASPSALSPPLSRPYGDLDLVGRTSQRFEIVELLAQAGYEPDSRFNALHGTRRLLFRDAPSGRHVDVFLDKIEMCHVIDLRTRLGGPGPALSPADLLLMKLQIVESNDKDLVDILALFIDHGRLDDEMGIDLGYIAQLTASDWCLWRTITMVAERAAQHADHLHELPAPATVRECIHRFVTALDDEPKTTAWKLRAKIGDRKRWYQLPEEVNH